MSGRPALVLAILLGSGLAAPDDPRPARPSAISLRLDAPPGGKAAVIVAGLDAANLDQLARGDWDADRLSELLSLSIAPGKGKPLPITGTYRVDGDALRFEPKFPIEPGLAHVARLDPSRLPIGRPDAVARLEFTVPAPRKPAPAFVARVEPSGDVVPENLLKFYVHFSAPMSRGEVYDRVRLADASGRKIDSALLEVGEELWDGSGTRITLLLDPGRIKRGLRPREEEGPILESGKSYSLVIDREWPDAAGQPMREAYRKTFRAGPAREGRLDPKSWVVKTPPAASKSPIIVTFPQPLDRAMLDHALAVLDARGEKVAGRVSIGEGSTRWEFTPSEDWSPGRYRLDIDPELEDLAGNSVARAFEVDIQGPIDGGKHEPRVRLPITIAPR